MTRDLLIREIESLFPHNPIQRRRSNGFGATEYEFEATTVLRLPAVHFKRSFTVKRGSPKNKGSQLNEPGQPEFRNPDTASADPQVLLNIVDWLNVDESPRYRSDGGSTWCNIYAYDYCTFAGAYLPHVWWKKENKMPTMQQIAKPKLGTDVKEYQANDIFDWYKKHYSNFGWIPLQKTDDFTEMQDLANKGHVVVGVFWNPSMECINKETGKPKRCSGHVLMVIPESDKKRADRDANGVVTMPVHSQAGINNFAYGVREKRKSNTNFFKAWAGKSKNHEFYVKKLQSNGSSGITDLLWEGTKKAGAGIVDIFGGFGGSEPASPQRNGASPSDSTFSLEEAIKGNRKYSAKLGWIHYVLDINPLLGFPNTDPHEDVFALAVADWQERNGFSGTDVDGIIGPNTWKKMKAVLGIKTPAPSVPSSGKGKDSISAKIDAFQPLIDAIGQQFGLEPKIIRAIIAAESGGDPLKHSSGNYKGLMQAGTTDDHYDPEFSIRKGTQKFIDFRDKYLLPNLSKIGIAKSQLDGETLLRLTLASYNAGHVTVLKALEYAHRAGNWRNWLQPEHYKRALAFSGGYARYKGCTKNASSQEIRAAKAERLSYAGWIGIKGVRNGTDWRKYPDPPELPTLINSASQIMMCWIQTKYKNTGPYLDRFLRYLSM